MKEEILRLYAEGHSYRDICKRLGCSKATVAYHCGAGQKEANKRRMQDRRKATVISKRVENFQTARRIKDKAEDFQRERIMHNNRPGLGKRTLVFRWRDVIDKFGWETVCYLTGRPINLREPRTYQFDHITPYGKGGASTLENLGIVCKEANLAKSDLTVPELLGLCKEILEHHGYIVSEGLGIGKPAPLEPE